MTLSSDKLPIVISGRTGVPIATTRQVLRRLREGNLLAGGKPAPRLRPRDVGRILMALASPKMGTVPEDTTRLETLPLTSAHAAPLNAGLAMQTLVAGMVGVDAFGAFDLTEGYVEVHSDAVTICCRDATGRPSAITYGRPPASASRPLTIPFTSVRALALAIL